MDLQEAEKLARLLMDHHGLQRWKFRIEYDFSLYGWCEISRKRICLSQPYVEYHTAGFVADIVLHEIAHALTGQAAQHNSPEWVSTVIALGGAVLNDSDNRYTLPGKYQARCSRCRRLHHAYSDPRSKAWYCQCKSEFVLKFHDVTRMKNPESRGFISKFVTLLPAKKRRKPRVK